MNIFFFILFIVAFLADNIYENYYREKELYNRLHSSFTLAEYYGKLWHKVQFAGWALVICYVTLNLISELWLAAKVILFIAAVWWILYDGALNSLKNRYFFYQSADTTSEVEVFAYPWVKAGLLLITIILLAWL